MVKRSKTKTAEGNRVAAYIRVSDESQVEGHSLDAQRQEIIRWCERHGYELVAVYSDEGVSAHTDKIDKRPALMRLLQDAKEGKFDIAVVHTLDRWARNLGVQSLALQYLGECGVGFASVTESFDYTSPNGKMFMNMMGSYSEFYSDQLAVHVSKSQRHKVSLGLPVGPVPFGYVVPEPGGVPQPDEKEAEAVREVFERRAKGESTGSIASWLNNSGLRTRKDRMFTAHAVKDMLNCRFYLGKIQYQEEEYPGQHQAIISEDLYARAQARRKQRGVTRTVVGPKGVLQGMLSCGNCGKGIQSDRHRLGGPMYRERHSIECATNGTSIMAHAVDEQIGMILQAVELHPNWKTRMAKLAATDREGPDPKKLQEKRERIVETYLDGELSRAKYEEKLAEIDGLLSLTKTIELPTLEEAAHLFQDISQLWEEATPEERRKLLSPLIERVYVDMGSRLVGAITPVVAFRTLLEKAMTRAESTAVMLLSEDETERLKVWSWWRRGRVELPVQKTPQLGYTTGLAGILFSLL
jgi:site-specific DNA recombinase